MILRFRTPDNEHYLNINFDAECYNVGRTINRHYLEISERGYSDILDELNFNNYGYSESLDTDNPNDYHPFAKSEFNRMCLDCPHLYVLCSGTRDKVYSGCIWKTAEPESLKKFNEETNNNLLRGGNE